MREIKFKLWNQKTKFMSFSVSIYKINYGDCDPDEWIPLQYTGLKDKNGKEGYYDSDIWEIKNYEYRVKWCNGFQVKKCDLRFTLKRGLLETEYEFINAPSDLKHICLMTIFNPIQLNGKRTFVDENRQKLEIIGSIQENPELLGDK